MTRDDAAAHAPMDQFAVVDDCLVVGGMPLTRLAARVGRTPFYAYDRGAARRARRRAARARCRAQSSCTTR